MNLEENVTWNDIKLSTRFGDRITALLNPVHSQNTQTQQFKTVASGTPNDNCGEESAIYQCKICGETYPVDHHCDRLECPICHSTAAARIGKRGSATLRSVNEALIEYLSPESACDAYGRQLPNASILAEYYPEAAKLANVARSGGLRQTIVSPPRELWQKWEGCSNIQMTRAFTSHVDKHLPKNIGGLYIYHPHRIKPEIRKKIEQYTARKQDCKEKYKNSRLQKRAKPRNTTEEEYEMDSVTSKGYWDAIHNNILNLPSQEDYVYFSPHYHIIHWGTMPNAAWYHARTKGWVYKITNHGKPIPLKIVIKDGQPLEDQLRAKITYLASHAGLFPTKT